MKFRSVLLFRDDKSIKEEAILESTLTDSETKKVTKSDMKNIWLNDIIIKHGIDLNTQLINYGIKITSDDPKVASDLAIIDYNTNLSKFLDKLTRETLVFGVAFSEYLYNKDKTKIVGL